MAEAETKFKPAEEMVVDNLDTLKVVADPLRLRILELMRDVCTVKQVAAELDIPPTKLYYHINLLEKHGLIVVVDTRVVSGIIEKHYQISARLFRVDRNLLTPGSPEGDESIALTLDTIYENTKTDLLQSVRDGMVDLDEKAERHRSMVLNSSRFSLTLDQAKEFSKRIDALIEEMSALSSGQQDRDDVKSFRFFYLTFPSSRRRISPENENTDS